MSRRTTLASSMGTPAQRPPHRLSYIPSAAKYSVANTRMSDAPGGSGVSSVYGDPAKGFKDTRNVTDKEMKHRMTRQVLEFVSADMPNMTVKSIQQPSTADFRRIFHLIIRHLMPDYSLEGKAMDKEIPVIVKKLGYPVPMKPSTFQTLSATHSWPHVLGMLTWLIDQVHLVEGVDVILHCTPMEEGDDEVLRARQSYIEAYKKECYFMHKQRREANQAPPADGEEPYPEQRALLSQRIGELDGHTDAELQDLMAENGRLTERIQMLREEPSEEEAVKNRMHDIKCDSRNIALNLTKEERKLASHEATLNKMNADIDNLHDDRKTLHNCISTLRGTIASQTMSSTEAHKLKMEHTKTEMNLKNVRVEMTRATKARDKMEMNEAEVIAKLDSLHRRLAVCAATFNDTVDGHDLSMWADKSPMHPGYDVFLEQEVETVLTLLSNKSRARLSALEDSKVQLERELARDTDKLSSVGEDRVELVAQVEHVKRQAQEAKTKQSRDMKTRKRRLEVATQRYDDLCKEQWGEEYEQKRYDLEKATAEYAKLRQNAGDRTRELNATHMDKMVEYSTLKQTNQVVIANVRNNVSESAKEMSAATQKLSTANDVVTHDKKERDHILDGMAEYLHGDKENSVHKQL